MRSMYNKRYSLIIHLKKDYYAISGSVKSAKNCASSNSKFKYSQTTLISPDFRKSTTNTHNKL